MLGIQQQSSHRCTPAADETILVADARSSAVPIRSWSYAALREFQWHPTRAADTLLGYDGGMDYQHARRASKGPCIWDCMAWSPDGTKLFAAGNDDVVAIDFLKAGSMCTWAVQLHAQARVGHNAPCAAVVVAWDAFQVQAHNLDSESGGTTDMAAV